MRFLLICFGFVFSVGGFAQTDWNNLKLMVDGGAQLSFENGNFKFSDFPTLDYKVLFLQGDYKIEEEILTLNKDPKASKNTDCDGSVFCGSTKIEPLKFKIEESDKKGYVIRLKALNPMAELFLLTLHKFNFQSAKTEKEFLKRKEIRKADSGYEKELYEKQQRMDFKILNRKAELKTLEFTQVLSVNGGNKIFDLLLDSTGYFVARDVMSEDGGTVTINYFQGKLEKSEFDYLNELYSSSGFDQIMDSTYSTRSYMSNNSSPYFEMWYQSNHIKSVKKLNKVQLKTYNLKFYEYIISFFRQTKYQGEDHHYNFTRSLYKKK